MSLIESILQWDTEAFLFLNGLGSESWDNMWLSISSVVLWIPLYALLLFLLYKVYGLKRFLWLLPFILLNVILTDTGSVWLFKEQFQRLRPCHVEGLLEQMRLVKHCGGQFGFVSSHSSNTFGLALLVGSLAKSKYPFLKMLLLFWACLVAYSRVYLGVHYPLDIIMGGAYGALCGYVVFRLQKTIILKRN